MPTPLLLKDIRLSLPGSLPGRGRQPAPDSSTASTPQPATRLSQGLVSHSFYCRYGKRALDLALGVPLLLLVTPIIALAALAVLVTSGWPVFYGAERQGKAGQPFRMWKLRTMVRDADKILERWQAAQPDLAAKYEREFKLQNDPRVTKLGRFLRKSSLDELPQLLNVIRGEMSLVGPRPITEPELRRYGAHAGTLLSLRPGVSGRWQTDGRNQTTYADRMGIELEYCRSARLLGDIRILVMTLATPFRYNGA